MLGRMTSAALDRTLILVRHAKAAATNSEGDHERELTPAGRADAEAAGAWLHGHDIGIDEVLCSSAERARQTAEGIWAGGCCEADVRYDQRIYNAGAEALLQVVREAEDDASVVMVVGHAPGIPALTSLHADGEGSSQAHDALAVGFPTTGIAVLSFAGHWQDLALGAARLERFHVARP